MKKILSVIIIILLVIIGGLWWYIRSNPSAPTSAPGVSSSPTVPFPIASDRAINVISQPGSTNTSSFSQNEQSASSTTTRDSYTLFSNPIINYHYTTIATSSVLMFIDRDSGNLYAVRDGEGVHAQRITNTTLLGIEKVWWTESKDRLYSIISSREGGFPSTVVYSTKKNDILASLTGSSSPTALTREGALDSDFIDIAEAPSGSTFLLLSKHKGDEVIIDIVDASTLKKKRLSTTLPLTELSAVWNNAHVATLSTHASFSAPGTLFALDTVTGALTRLLGAQSNFTALTDPTRENILYTDGSRSKIKSTHATSTQILTLSAIPEKCVWSSLYKGLLYCAIPHDSSKFLLQHDAWLRGEYSTRDDIWWIDTRSGTADVLTNFSQTLDASLLSLNSRETALTLKNRVTGALLSIPIPQETSD